MSSLSRACNKARKCSIRTDDFSSEGGGYGDRSGLNRGPIGVRGSKTDRIRGLRLRKNRAKEPINTCRNPEVFAKLLGSNDPSVWIAPAVSWQR